MEKMMADIKELPKLPHGMGDYTYVKDKIRFRKSITINGKSKRLSVTGSTINEVNKLMKEKENNFIKQTKILNTNTSMLQDNMQAWLELYKIKKVLFQIGLMIGMKAYLIIILRIVV